MNHAELISSVFHCTQCKGISLPFVSNSAGKFYRFPPIIGHGGNSDILFVGINPRVSKTNLFLHDSIVDNYLNFASLSENCVDGQKYIGIDGLEHHYDLHVNVVNSLFPDRSFDEVAAVTELHFCASASSVGLPRDFSICAQRHFMHVVQIVLPKIVFAVGKHVERTLLRHFCSQADVPSVQCNSTMIPLITLPHPNSWGSKGETMTLAIERAKSILFR